VGVKGRAQQSTVQAELDRSDRHCRLLAVPVHGVQQRERLSALCSDGRLLGEEGGGVPCFDPLLAHAHRAVGVDLGHAVLELARL